MAQPLDLTQVLNQLTIPGLIAYGIQWMKNSKSPVFSWITVGTPWITRILAVVAAAGTAVGMTWTYTGGTLTITNLTWATVALAVWHVAQNYLLQHGWYKAIFKDAPPLAPAAAK